MSMQLPIFLTPFLSPLLGLAIMVCFGTTWFLMSKTAKVINPWHSQFLFQLLGIPLLLLLGAWLPLPEITISQMLLIGGLGIATTLSLVLFLQGLEIGEASIISPLADTSLLISVFLGAWLLHEPLPIQKILGVTMVFGGAVLLGSDFQKLRRARVGLLKGVPQAVFSAVIWGVTAIGVTQVVRDSHWFYPTLGIRVVITLISFAVLWRRNKKLAQLFVGVPWKYLVPAAVLDVAAFSLYNFGLQSHAVAYILAFSAAQSLVTALLSWKFSHEKLLTWQYLGLSLIIGGLIVINILS